MFLLGATALYFYLGFLIALVAPEYMHFIRITIGWPLMFTDFGLRWFRGY